MSQHDTDSTSLPTTTVDCLECHHQIITRDSYKLSGTIFFPILRKISSSENTSINANNEKENTKSASSSLREVIILDDNLRECAIVIGSAMGVPSRFYREFARFLCLNTKCIVMSFDFRGCFKSRITKDSIDGVKFDEGKSEREIFLEIQKKFVTIVNWGRFDLPAVMDYLENSSLDKLLKCESNNLDVKLRGECVNGVKPINEFVYIAHSIGGQVLAYCPNEYLCKFKGTIMIASQSGVAQHWPWIIPRLLLYVYWYIMLPTMTTLYRMETPPINVANQLVTDWYSAGRCNTNYIFEYFGIEEAKINPKHPSWALQNKAMIAYVIENDFYAPFQASLWLLRSISDPTFISNLKLQHLNGKSTNITKKRITFQNDEPDIKSFGGNQKRMYYIHGKVAKKIGHFNFFREQEGKDECWPHLLKLCLELLESPKVDSTSNPLLSPNNPFPARSSKL
ncbi:predicted protein [Naegleria gruberi]|uniref:Predicted protein n=1 Tax=Naegleria gruberi TaxID=5762 RepID=D2VF15_NAEGR|nr:uncharacterized protein NAEGRDRAFT_67469 [Naegleria gruberi]EFC44697.1 predicted protein [Naegleria gruberi]|eukprot:XP_002677441.1 predicted protein [Naegleria gruberi strain NEG-M]